MTLPKKTGKLINCAFFYAILAMAGGAFYREFTKFSGFQGRTNLGFVHVHLFVLGMLFFLVLALLEAKWSFSQEKLFPVFFGLYHAGLLVTASTLVWRGITQVRGMELSRAVDASISGIAGLGHILLGTGVILFFVCLKASLKKEAGQ